MTSKYNKYPESNFYDYQNDEDILKAKKQYHNYGINKYKLNRFSSKCFTVDYDIGYNGIDKIPENVVLKYSNINSRNYNSQLIGDDASEFVFPGLDDLLDDFLNEC